ncbi:MAG TPA: hypothetical protein VFK89_03680 [Actinomycetota bacterium]|nr:hypothetical protein [Actinomycetota bacterium]
MTVTVMRTSAPSWANERFDVVVTTSDEDPPGDGCTVGELDGVALGVGDVDVAVGVGDGELDVGVGDALVGVGDASATDAFTAGVAESSARAPAANGTSSAISDTSR